MKNRQKRFAKFTKQLHGLVALKPTVKDIEVSLHTGLPIRTIQRHLSALKKDGLIAVENKRHLHHAYGWCNERTITFPRSY